MVLEDALGGVIGDAGGRSCRPHCCGGGGGALVTSGGGHTLGGGGVGHGSQGVCNQRYGFLVAGIVLEVEGWELGWDGGW